MLIGFVSDEMFAAIAGVAIELRRNGESFEASSRASGAVYADIPPGAYECILSKSGYGPKRVTAEIAPGRPWHFRLLRDSLLGYAWPKWVRSGDESELCVHSPSTYSIELWRYGWTKELIRKIGTFEDYPAGSNRQLLPDGDFTQVGVNWNRLGFFLPDRNRRKRIAAPERSGLYYFHATSAAGESFSFPWVVAPLRPAASVAVLASTNTWNAYNDFGGRSNYVTAVGLPPEPSVHPRQEAVWFRETGADWWGQDDYAPLSFDRPERLNTIAADHSITDPMVHEGDEHVAPAEWRLLGWLEREGFAYDLYADAQLHNGVLPLDEYKVLILSTHPEYWSREMYDRVKRWVFERGGRLMYLGGNGLNCAVEFQGEEAMIARNGDCRAGRARWAYAGEGALFPSRFGARVEEESHLLGVQTTLTGMNTGAPYKVIAADHWVFEGLGVRNGDLVGHLSLDCRCPGGASGHETDKMNASSPADAILLAKGSNPNHGGGEMVYFDTPVGGAVFSVGSISYTCSIAVDPQISTITANVLRRFLEPL